MKKEVVVTHVFPGYLHFHVVDMIRDILNYSSLKSRFVIYCSKEMEHVYLSTLSEKGMGPESVLFVNGADLFCNDECGVNLFARSVRYASRLLRLIIRSVRILRFSSRRVVSHCRQWELSELLLAKLLCRRITWVCWGDIPKMEYDTTCLMQMYYKTKMRIRMRLYYHVVTLMSSDKKAIAKWFGNSLRISVQPYPAHENMFSLKASAGSKQVLLLGNSASQLMHYPEVLDRINVADWDEILCMLNYGHEKKQDEVDSFVEKYKRRFGDKFKPWRKVVPYDEYIRVLSRCVVYASPCPRQIGLGAIYPMLIMGRKVYVYGANYEWLIDLGVVAFNLQKEDLSDTKKMCTPLCTEEKECNLSRIRDLLDVGNNSRRWDEIYLGRFPDK